MVAGMHFENWPTNLFSLKIYLFLGVYILFKMVNLVNLQNNFLEIGVVRNYIFKEEVLYHRTDKKLCFCL